MTCEIKFSVEAKIGNARAGRLELARGAVQTPVFMPVGTQGAIRTLSPLHLAQTGSQIILANTYHLSQRPGETLVAKHGGIHNMMNVEMPVLTDSGGFQVFSLDKKEVTEEGVNFNYELDGRSTFLSPETSMAIQQQIGSDIAMVFDECLAFGTDVEYAKASVDRTTRWERRSKEAHTRPDQSLFGIVQGGFWPDLRKRSAEAIQDIGFDGYAIGGLSVGEGHQKMIEVLKFTLPHMSETHPRYLMGVGRPLDLVEAVAEGVDMFDCVIPTRHARSGMFYTWTGRVRMTDARYRRDMYPPDTSCNCYTCTNFTRAYIHHLFRVGEVLGATLTTLHNLTWFAAFMAKMRESIVDGSFEQFRVMVHKIYPERPVNPSGPRQKPKEGSSRKRKKSKPLGNSNSSRQNTRGRKR
jgi:queuine tRNA-ribosyltransferase